MKKIKDEVEKYSRVVGEDVGVEKSTDGWRGDGNRQDNAPHQ